MGVQLGQTGTDNLCGAFTILADREASLPFTKLLSDRH